MTENTAPQVEEDVTYEEEPLITEEAMKNAQQGIFMHTLFEMWESSINQLRYLTDGPLPLEVAQSILTTYPWLTHADLEPYMIDRGKKFGEAVDALNKVLGVQKVKIYSENLDDWELHSELYIELIMAWKALSDKWGNEWAENKPHRVKHATILDVSTSLLNSEVGLIEGIKNLKGFEITVEHQAKLASMAG